MSVVVDYSKPSLYQYTLDFSCLKCYIFAKLSQTVKLKIKHILIGQHTRWNDRFSDVIDFWAFSYELTYHIFVYFSSKPMFPLFLWLPQKKTQIIIYKTKIRIVVLVILKFCLCFLWFVARLQPTSAYVEAWNIY